MRVILSEDVPNVGKTGEIVNVKDGFGRNYLVPRGLAMVANSKNVSKLEHDKRVIAQRDAKLMRTAEAVQSKLQSVELTIAKRVGSGDKLFGSVTTKEIAEGLAAKGIEIDRRKVRMLEPIRTVGEHAISINLGREMTASVKVWVVAK